MMHSDLLLRKGPALLFVLWAAAAVIVATLRPGQLLELATIGVVGVLAWRSMRGRRSIGETVLGALCLLLPLMNTWPARIYQSAVDPFPLPVPAILSLVSLSAMASLAVPPAVRTRAPRLLMVAWGLLVVGGVVASFGSGQVMASLGNTWIAFIAPVGFAMVVANRWHREEDGWQVISLLLLGALVPLTMAIAAYALSFGIPTSGDDLVAARVLLFRPHLLQEVTFGNIAHLADFVLLVLPAAVFTGTRRASSMTMRLTALLTAGASVVVLSLILVRSAVIVAELALLSVFVVLVARKELRAAIVPLVGITVLTTVALSPEVRATYASLVPTVSIVTPSPTPPQIVAPSASLAPSGSLTPGPSRSIAPSPSRSPVASTNPPTVVVGPIQVVASDPSQRERIDAIQTGAAVFAAHMPWGVGSGQYDLYDPAHSASHSLVVQTLVEIGVLGATGLVLLYLFVVREAVRLLLRLGAMSTDSSTLRWACVLGAGSFLVQGLIAGAPLAIGVVSVWASIMWILLSMLGSLKAEVRTR